MPSFSEHRLLRFSTLTDAVAARKKARLEEIAAVTTPSNVSALRGVGSVAEPVRQTSLNQAVAAQNVARQNAVSGAVNAMVPNVPVNLESSQEPGHGNNNPLRTDANGNIITGPDSTAKPNQTRLTTEQMLRNAGVSDPILLANARARDIDLQNSQAQLQMTQQQAAQQQANMNAASTGAAVTGGSRLTQIANIRAMERQGQITPEQAQQMIQQANQGHKTATPSGSSPVSTPQTSQDPAPQGSPTTSQTQNAPTGQKTGSTSTPQGTSGTQNGQPVQTPQQIIQGSSIDAALQTLLASSPPEMAPYLQAAAAQAKAYGALPQGQELTFDQWMAQNTGMAQGFDAIQGILNGYQTNVTNSDSARKDFLKNQLDRTTQFNAHQQENITNQLIWQEGKLKRDLADANKQQLDQMTSSLALAGGFGSSNGLQEISEARQKGEQAIVDLQKEFGFKRTDVMMQFTQLTNQAYDNYQIAWLDATDKFQSTVANIAMQGISNQQAKKDAINTGYKTYIKDIKDARIEAAKVLTAASETVFNVQNQMKVEERQAEADALDRIDYLLKTYPREQVADAISELSKNVKSFDASILGKIDTTAALDKLSKARGGGSGSYSSFLPMPDEAPIISYDDFTSDKLAEMEEEKGMSFAPSERDRLMKENAAAWEAEYQSQIGPSYDSMPSSGNSRVDSAAKDLLEGVFGNGVTSAKQAAAAWGVSVQEVVQQRRTLEQSGYIPAFPTLTGSQAGSYTKLKAQIQKNSFYTKANEAVSNGGVVLTSLDQRTGIGDIAAINAMQSGLIDPGATVRAEDIKLINAGVAVVDKFSTKFWRDKLATGIILPDEARAQMRQVANNIMEMRIRNYNENALPGFQQDAQRYGLPANVVKPMARGQSTFTTPQGDTFDLDAYLNSQGLQ